MMKCGKAENYKKECKSKEAKVSDQSVEKLSTTRNMTLKKGGYVYLELTST
jgi:hypothetical protein